MVRTYATSRLSSVNDMLSAIGENPVNSLTGSTGVVAMADSILDRVDREVQSKGWHWNRQTETISENSSGEYEIPPNFIRLDFNLAKVDPIIRDGILFNLYDGAPVNDEGDLQATVTVFLEFDELPEYARHYMTIRAGRVLHDRVIGSARHHQWSKEDELAAWAVLMKQEARQADYTMFRDPAVASILARGRAPLRDFSRDVQNPKPAEGGAAPIA